MREHGVSAARYSSLQPRYLAEPPFLIPDILIDKE